MTLSIFDLDEAFGGDEPRTAPAIPPPPVSDIADLRFAQHRAPGAVVGAVFVWGQGDAYAITRDEEPPSSMTAPASDVTALHAQLRETVRPGRRCA
jgi:hypothetical protein